MGYFLSDTADDGDVILKEQIIVEISDANADRDLLDLIGLHLRLITPLSPSEGFTSA